MFTQYSLNRILVFVVAAGFAFLLADTTIEHWSVLQQEYTAFIPVVFSVVALVIAAGAFLKWTTAWIRALRVFLFASCIVAAAGLYFHIAEEEDDENLTQEQQLHEEKEKDKPLLAPLTFGGLGIVGLLGTERKWHAEVVESERSA